MAAALTDKFKKAGASTVTSLAAPGKAIGATSITVGSTTNYPLDTGVVIAIRVVDTAGNLIPGTYTEWNAIVTSATSFTLDPTPVYGSDQVYAAGSSTQVFISVSSIAHNQLVDGLLVSHDQDGTLKAGAVDVAAVLADDVVETAKIKDANVTTAKIANSAVTNDKVGTGMPVQMVSVNSTAVATGTTTIPLDDTIPQNTEGNEFMTLAVTPKSATNTLVIEANLSVASSAANNLITALFQDTTADALAVSCQAAPNTNQIYNLTVRYSMVAGTTSATTFKVRVGGNGAATFTFNGFSAARYFGATAKSSMTITEYKA